MFRRTTFIYVGQFRNDGDGPLGGWDGWRDADPAKSNMQARILLSRPYSKSHALFIFDLISDLLLLCSKLQLEWAPKS